MMRPSAETFVISAMTRPAPPIAREPRWTRCHSLGAPSADEYWHIGDTTTRFASVNPRSVNGANIGGAAEPSARRGAPCFRAKSSSTCRTSSGSRLRRLSYVIRCERVSRLNWNGSGSCRR